MGIFKDFFGERDENIILEENKQLRKKRKYDKEDYKKLKGEYDDVVKKYISLLEEKSKGFDQYLYYHDLYAKKKTKTKEQKKEIAKLKSEVKRLNEQLEKKKTKRGGKNAKAEE